MDVANSRVNSRSRREAERWFVRLLDAAEDDPRRQEFAHWLAASPAHADAYRETVQLWRLGKEAAGHPDIEAAAACVLRRAPTRIVPRRIRLVPALVVAFGLVLLTGLTVYGWNVFVRGQTDVHYATATDHQRTIQLRDGSTMLLDADSSVVVHYRHHARTVVLLRGRAEFRVRHDKDSPFVVRAEGGAVTDVGTTFQVGIGERGEVRVVLLEGQVSVATAHVRTTLTSGEGLRFNRAGAVHGPYPADLPAALGWTSGEIVARGWPLPRLLDEMNRYSRIKVRTAGAGLRGIRITGTFQEGDQKTLVRVLEAGWPVRARRVSDTRIELSRK